MRLRDLPVVGSVRDAGPDDRIFDGLLLAGPVVVLLPAVAGRNPLTIVLAAGYLATLVGYVGYRAARKRTPG